MWAPSAARVKASRRRLRRRWPGVSAGLRPWEARPAHAGPQHAEHADQHRSHDRHAGTARSPLPRHPLSGSRPPRLGRSLRSRRMRSAAPNLDPAPGRLVLAPASKRSKVGPIVGTAPDVPLHEAASWLGNDGDLHNGATAGSLLRLAVTGDEAPPGTGHQHRMPGADRPVGTCCPVCTDGAGRHNRWARTAGQRNHRNQPVPRRASALLRHVDVDMLAQIQRHPRAGDLKKTSASTNVHHTPMHAHQGRKGTRARLGPPRPGTRSGSRMRHATGRQQASSHHQRNAD